MAKVKKPPKPQHLPPFVGYSQVEDSLGVSRRTIERMVMEGRFPKPLQLVLNRVGWQVETVTGWLSERGQGLVAQAVAHVEDLSPDELEDKALDLIVKSLEQRSGKLIDPSNLAYK
jgi:predicted DNA-binding transcriptional regulator AlpA